MVCNFGHGSCKVNVFLLHPVSGPPQRVLSSFLHSFVNSNQGGIPFRPTPLPVLGLSEGDKQCIRDRSSIMARHFFADKSEDFINAQVSAHAVHKAACFFSTSGIRFILNFCLKSLHP